MIKSVKILGLVGTLSASLAFPAAPVHAANEKIVAIFHDLAEPFFVFMAKAGHEAAAEEKVRLSVIDGQESSAKESTDLENALSQGVDGIIIAPTDVKAVVPAVNDAIENKTPLITVDRRVEGAEKPVPHVGADNVAGGRIQAEWVIKTFPNGARIVFLTGNPGSGPAIDRAKGVHEAIAAAGDKYKIVAEQTAFFCGTKD